jgi:hypothetical protein
MISALHQQEMKWQFIDYQGIIHVQVEQYPPLRPSRCAGIIIINITLSL